MVQKLQERNSALFLTKIHHGIQPINGGLRKGEWEFGGMTIPCAEKAEVTHQGGFEEGVCEEEMNLTKVLEMTTSFPKKRRIALKS